MQGSNPRGQSGQMVGDRIPTPERMHQHTPFSQAQLANLCLKLPIRLFFLNPQYPPHPKFPDERDSAYWDRESRGQSTPTTPSFRQGYSKEKCNPAGTDAGWNKEEARGLLRPTSDEIRVSRRGKLRSDGLPTQPPDHECLLCPLSKRSAVGETSWGSSMPIASFLICLICPCACEQRGLGDARRVPRHKLQPETQPHLSSKQVLIASPLVTLI